MGHGLSRRRLLRAGIVGAGIATVAPRVALRAIADGFGPVDGVWSVARDAASGRFAGLVGTDTGAAVHEIVVARDGLVRLGPVLGVGIPGFDAVAIGVRDGRFLLLGAQAAAEAPIAAGPITGPIRDPRLAGEPDPPTRSSAAVPYRPIAAAADIVAGTTATATTPGFLTAAVGQWSVLQHGADGEADHLTELTVRAAGRAGAPIGGLPHAGLAGLGGPAVAPVVTVADGLGAVRVLPTDGSSAPDLADHATTVATWASGSVLATDTDADGRLLVAELRRGRWEQRGAVPGTEGVSAVLAVAGSPHLLVTMPGGTALIDPVVR